MSALVPGSGLAMGGRVRLGAFVMTVTAALVAAGVLIGVTRRGDVLAAAVSPDRLLTAAVALAVLALCWIVVIVWSHRLLRPATTRRTGRALGSALVGLLCFAIAAPAAVGVQNILAQRDLVQNVFASQSDSRSATRPSVNVKDPWADKPRLNLLLLGGDDGKGRVGTRTDTVIVASIDTRTGDTALISMPRQLTFMPFPADSPLHKVYPNGFGREGLSLEGRLEWMLTAMYQNVPEQHPGILGPSDNEGADVLKQSVGAATGLHIDYYLQVNLQGFDEVVDALGGITVNVNERVAIGGVSSLKIPPKQWIEPGPDQHLDGYHALWFVRGRYGADDDQRQIRQRCAIRAIVDAANPGTLVTKYQTIARAGRHLLRTDIPQELLPELVQLGLRVKAGKVSNVPLDVEKLRLKYLHPDYAGLRRTVAEALDPATGPTTGAADAGKAGPGQTAAPGDTATPAPATTPTQDLRDACVYHPDGQGDG
ncbi:MAG TPA: LCP family protein [Kribbella sp.]|nr:LCP family protein [Kribbella sp.]